MENSILNSTKKILNIAPDYTAFDLDILTQINATFSVLSQLIDVEDSFYVEDETKTWDSLDLPADQTNLIRSYIPLKVKLLFDPPGTSFLLDATNKQIAEFEWRLNSMREKVKWDAAEAAEETV